MVGLDGLKWEGLDWIGLDLIIELGFVILRPCFFSFVLTGDPVPVSDVVNFEMEWGIINYFAK